MALSSKLKTALDETRTLMLGAQILLGFQFHGAFQERFDSLSHPTKIIDATALLLVLTSVGLLIAPSAFHRIVDRGKSTGRTQTITSFCAAASLPPFNLALGIDITIGLTRTLQSHVIGIAAGAGFALTGIVAWFGLGWIMRRHQGAEQRRKAASDRHAKETAPLHSRIEQMLTEARVILPGAQALLGFQLAIVLTETFEKLPILPRMLHATALLSVALSVTLLITPAALHRIVWAGEDTEALLRYGGRITVLALLPLAMGLAEDTYVVLFRCLSGSAGPAAVAALLVFLCLTGLWFAWPIAERWHRNSSLTEETSRSKQSVGGR
jgi:Family of unknown function (DUF6328)